MWLTYYCCVDQRHLALIVSLEKKLGLTLSNITQPHAASSDHQNVTWCGAWFGRGAGRGVMRGVVRGVAWCGEWCGAWCGVDEQDPTRPSLTVSRHGVHLTVRSPAAGRVTTPRSATPSHADRGQARPGQAYWILFSRRVCLFQSAVYSFATENNWLGCEAWRGGLAAVQ